MRTPFVAALAAALLAACATGKSEGPPPVEVKATGVPGEAMATTQQTLSVTVKALDRATRKMTVQAPSGETDTFTVSPGVKRLDEINVGDQITVEVTQGLLLQYQPAGTEAVAPQAVVAGAVADTSLAPGGAIAGGVQGTVTVVAIDQKTRLVTFQVPDGNKYKVKAGPKIALERLQVGDRLLATYVATVAIAVDKKR